jgi:hypothetical protein
MATAAANAPTCPARMQRLSSQEVFRRTKAKPIAKSRVLSVGRLMNLTTRLPKRRSTRPRRSSRPGAVESDEVRAARRAGGPEDRALYSCMCGYAFKASVTTSVGCPHCGTEQAW